MELLLTLFSAIWLIDFEFQQPDGARPTPICLVAKELRTGRVIRLFGDDLNVLWSKQPPFSTDSDSLFVAFYSSAEWSCFLALDWPLPVRILDLYAEFRCRTSGLSVPCGNGLLGALAHFGIDAMAGAEKGAMRQLAMRGGPYTESERQALSDYCESDVDALARLLPVMLPRIDLPRALLRGRYMAAAARVERNGTPLDVPNFTRLTKNWNTIQEGLIRRLDTWGIWEGRTFHADRFAAFLQRQNIPWPRLPSGNLALDDDTFRMMAKAHPVLWPIRELRHALSSLRLNDLAVGPDGRNRCLVSAFGSKTSRNQPSNSRFIFGPSVWLRGLIKPPEGRVVAYVDWEQQEFGIAAALSGDKVMMEAYRSGDPYLAFAKQARAVPQEATKDTHPKERDRFKVCALAVQYGQGAESLALALGEAPAVARELLRLHHQTYRTLWAWSESAVNFAMLHGYLETVFGWRVHVGPDANPRSLSNFPMQANGAEMLRLACCTATETGIVICAPVHDAVLIEASVDEIETAVSAMREHMRRASEIVLGGFPLRTEPKIVRYPDRYMDKRGKEMWKAVMDLMPTAPEPGQFADTPPVPETGIYLPGSGTPGQSYVSSVCCLFNKERGVRP